MIAAEGGFPGVSVPFFPVLGANSATQFGTGIREGEAPTEPLPGAGLHGGSPFGGNSGPYLRGAVLRD
jgi:hypothetical protein